MMPYSRALTPISDSTAPNGSSGVDESSLLRGANTATATITTSDTTTLTTNTAPHQNDGKIHQPVSRNPAIERAERAARRRRTRPRSRSPWRVRAVGTRRSAATASPASRTRRRCRRSPAPRSPLPTSRRRRPAASRAANTASPHEQRLLAPEAVADRAGRQQQAGEHDRVRVDDPLQVGGAGVRASAASTAGRR